MRSKKKKNGKGWIFVVAILLSAIFMLWNSGKNTQEVAREIPVGDGKVYETLSPSFFSGKIAKGYRVAKEDPELLSKLFCYCYCEMGSLLGCYKDDHASNCSICIGEAILAQKLKAQGYSIEEIIKAIDDEFGG
ncbi:MAG: CYCXC family (seleno)protein [Candidatus Methanofastidiosia archaeon]